MGMGMYMGTTMGTMAGMLGPSVWVPLWHGCGRQDTPLVIMMGFVITALFRMSGTSAGFTIVSVTVLVTVLWMICNQERFVLNAILINIVRDPNVFEKLTYIASYRIILNNTFILIFN